MKCLKCEKEMARPEGDNGPIIAGINVRVRIIPPETTPETIEYNNRQLGRYSDGNGECDVAICYECYIDGLFHVRYET